MKAMNWSQLNIILVILTGSMLLLCIIAGCLYQGKEEAATGFDVRTLNDSWILETEDDYDISVDLPCRLEVPKGDTVSISHFLPDTLGNDFAIAFRSVYNTVQVKIGNQVIYQYGVDEKRPFVKAPVPKWNLIPVDAEYAGQLITITQVSDYGKYAGFFTEVQIGSRDALRYLQWRENGWSVILSAVLLLLCIGLMLTAFIMRKQLKDKRYVLYYGIFAGVVMLHGISGNPLLASVSGMSYMFWMVHMLMRLLVPIVYLMFLRTFMQNRRQLMLVDIGIIISGIGYVVLTVLQVLGLWEYAITYGMVNLICGLGFVLYTVCITWGWLKYQKTELRLLSISNLALCAAGLVQIFVRPKALYQLEGTFWQVSVMLYCFLLLAVVIEAYIREMHQQSLRIESTYEGQRAEAVAMMNPNFLFSVLNTILTMTKNGSGQASKLIFAFSEYLRYNLNSIREDSLIPFEEELKHITTYLEIQQYRMPELQIQIENKMHDFYVPARSLEAIVENAVKHGIGKNHNQGKVIIRSYERRDSYAVQIVDEGIGFDTDMLYRKETPTGMKRIRERLTDRSGAALDVVSRMGKGTIVTVKFPKNQK